MTPTPPNIVINSIIIDGSSVSIIRKGGKDCKYNIINRMFFNFFLSIKVVIKNEIIAPMLNSVIIRLEICEGRPNSVFNLNNRTTEIAELAILEIKVKIPRFLINA